MSKTYQRDIVKPRDFAHSDKWNDEVRGWLQEFNGKLDAQQLPYEAFGEGVFSNGINMDGLFDTNSLGTQQNGVGHIHPTQAYYYVKSEITADTWERPVESGTVTLLGPPAMTRVSSDGDWHSGIRPLTLDIDNGVFMRIPTKSGMIHGNAQVDLEYYFVEKTVGDPPASGNFGAGWTWQIYAFIDDLMVGTCGPQPAGKRKTVNIPFSIPIPTKGSVQIDIRWSATFDGAGGINPWNSIDDATINIFNTSLYVRNQNR